MSQPYKTFKSFDLFCTFMYNQYLKEKHEWDETDIKDKNTYISDNSEFLDQNYKSRTFEG